MVQEHNQPAAHAWNQGGHAYDFVSFGISDALSHAAQLLWPRPGEHILDVATGTGWSARNAAFLGANVTAVDIADELLDAARALASHIRPAIEFRHADAEALPFDDHSFDGVISTFGVMFAGSPERAAAELARVCRPGGRLVLATWTPDPDDYVGRFFAVIGKHRGAPPPTPSPLDWGRPERVEELLGDAFRLDCKSEITTFFAPDGMAIWDQFSVGFGPLRLLAESLGAEQRSALREDFINFHEEYRTEGGLRFDRKYLLTKGIRR